MQQSIEQGVDTGDCGKRMATEFLDKPGHITRVGDQDVAAAQVKKSKAVRGQCEDVIER